MAGSSSPFAGLSQVDGAAGSTGRGRGFHGRSASQPSKTPQATRGSNTRGRGRGTSPATRAGRGKGPASNTWRRKPEANTTQESSSSPFAQLKQNNPFSSVSNGQSPLNPAARSFGAPRTPTGLGKMVVDSSRDVTRQMQTRPPVNGATDVPVEDASVLNWYNSRFEQLKVDRMKERERAIKEGLMADPNQPTKLNQAITPVGTCTSMCPEFERVERIVQKMVDRSEKFLHPSTNSLQYMEMKMLKRFRRSAAGYDEQLPSDIRTPKTLLQTMNYLIRHVVGGPEPLGVIHKFVWDRTRSIRNDFSVQQLTQEDHVRIATTCLERIARFHIVSLHLLSSPANEEQFDRHQEREQLNNTMLSLMYYYDDNRGRISFPNEDEFRAYYIIFSIHDQRPDLEARVQKWPAEIRSSPRVQTALELYAAAGNSWEYQGALDARRQNPIAQGFYSRFFNLVDSPCVSYLMACVAEIYFNQVRQTAIRSIWRAYCRYPASQQHKNEEWTINELTAVLCFDDDSQTIKFCEEQDLELAENSNGELYLNWGSRPVDSVAFQPSSDHGYSEKSVESKRAGRSLVAVILGLSIEEAASLGMVDISLLRKRTLPLSGPKSETSGDDDSLFVSEDGNEALPSIILTNGTPPDTVPFGGIADSASSLRNEVEESTRPSSTGPWAFQTDGSMAPPQRPSHSQPPEPPKTFSSLFTSGMAKSTSPFTTSKAAASSPFAASLNPFNTHKPEGLQEGIGKFSSATVPEQSAPSFPSSSPFQPAGKKDDAAAPAHLFTTPPPTTPQFKLPSFSQMTSPPVPATSVPATGPNQNAGLSASKPAASIFDSHKPPPFSINAPPTFNFHNQGTVPKEASIKASWAERGPVFSFPSQTAPSEINAIERTTEPAEPAQETPSPLFPSTTSSALLPPKQKEISSIFPSTTPATTPPSSIFSDMMATAVPTPGPASFGLNQVAPDATTETQKQVQNVPASALEQISSWPSHAEQRVPPHEHLENAATVDTAPAPPELKEPVLATEDLATMPQAEETTENGEPATAAGADEGLQSWIDILQGAAVKRRQEISASRKRVRDEPPVQELEDNNLKASKMPKPDEIRRPTSLALSSIKPLPKLPILEQIESAIARKPKAEKKPERPRPNQIDEDELLLSAARIAAESLRSGPKIFDDMSINYEPRRSSFSPRRSFSSSLPFSRSVSPQSYAGGYDVAYAPDTSLGLGRTMSRTEQRIRMTGGKGLAYKPLDFTPQKALKGKGKERAES